MQLKKMDHTTFVVGDLDRGRWFYGQVLGLREIARPSNFNFGGCWFQGSGFQIHLVDQQDTTAPSGLPDPGADKARGLCHHIAFEVEDLEATLVTLNSHGIEILGGPQPRGDGATQLFVNDPWGHCLEFFQWKSSDA